MNRICTSKTSDALNVLSEIALNEEWVWIEMVRKMNCENKKFGSVWIHVFDTAVSARKRNGAKKFHWNVCLKVEWKQCNCIKPWIFPQNEKKQILTFTKMDMLSISNRGIPPYETDKKMGKKKKTKITLWFCYFGCINIFRWTVWVRR